MALLPLLFLLAPAPVAQITPVAPVAIVSPYDAIGPEDFPPQADPGDTAEIHIKLNIDAQGRVTGCDGLKIEAKGRWTAGQFLDLTCKLARQRARFLPARDGQGNPIASSYSEGISWLHRFGSDGRLIKAPRFAFPVPPTVRGPELPMPVSVPRLPKAAMPKGNWASWAGPGDYPATLTKGETGTTSVRLLIGPDGRPKECSITKSSGHPVLDALTCALHLRRGRFSPATDRAGSAVQGSWSGQVRWAPPSSGIAPAP